LLVLDDDPKYSKKNYVHYDPVSSDDDDDIRNMDFIDKIRENP
jgi:hypothetical protein